MEENQKERFVKLYNPILELPSTELTARQKLIFAYIAHVYLQTKESQKDNPKYYFDGKFFVMFLTSKLSETLSVSKRVIRYTINGLIELGYLERLVRNRNKRYLRLTQKTIDLIESNKIFSKLYESELKDLGMKVVEKIMLAKIRDLSRDRRCTATNQTFSTMLGFSISYIQKIISNLVNTKKVNRLSEVTLFDNDYKTRRELWLYAIVRDAVDKTVDAVGNVVNTGNEIIDCDYIDGMVSNIKDMLDNSHANETEFNTAFYKSNVETKVDKSQVKSTVVPHKFDPSEYQYDPAYRIHRNYMSGHVMTKREFYDAKQKFNKVNSKTTDIDLDSSINELADGFSFT